MIVTKEQWKEAWKEHINEFDREEPERELPEQEYSNDFYIAKHGAIQTLLIEEKFKGDEEAEKLAKMMYRDHLSMLDDDTHNYASCLGYCYGAKAYLEGDI